MDQPPTQKTPSQPKALEPRRPSRARDALVLITVPLVAVAVTLALFLQLGQPIALSMAMGGLIGGLLIALHTIGRRDQTIKALRDELGRHNAQRGVQATTGQPRPAVRPESTAAGAPQAPQISKASAVAASDRALAERGAPPPRVPAIEARPAEMPAPPAQSAQPPPTGVARSQQSNVPPPLPQVVPLSQSPAVPTAAKPGPAAPPPLPPPMAALSDSGSKNPAAEPLMSPYWDLRPGAIREPALPGADPGAEETATQILRTTPIPAMTMKPLPARPASEADQRGDPVRPSEQELEVMHTLIEQLAIQLNDTKPSLAPAQPTPPGDKLAAGTASEAGALPLSSPAAGPPASKVEQSIEASLSALKVTAETMRRPPAFSEPSAPSGAGPTSTQPSVDQSAIEAEARAARTKPSSSSYSRLAVLTEAVAAERIEVFLDPIHGLDDRKARHFEVAIRLRSADDESLSADDYLTVATGTGLLVKIDQAKLARTARVADRLHARGAAASLFSGVSGESLTDDGFLDTFEAILGAQETLPSRLVLTFAQRDIRAFTDAHWDTMLTMAEIGVRFAIDHVTDLDMDFGELNSRGFDYVKLDAPVFLEGLPAADGPIPSADICNHLTGQGLALILGRIEDEMTMAKILGFGVVFGQGTLFGGARPVKVDLAPAPNVAAA